jgi:Transposase DDE domain
MPTSRLYDSTHATLTRQLSEACASQIETLALAVVGVTVSLSSAQGAIARALPITTDQDSKKQRLRRLWDNERITIATHFHPIAKASLTGLRGQRVSLLLDRVVFSHGQNVLVVSAAFRRRSIPLTWVVLEHGGASGLALHQQVLAEALALLPEGVRVTVHGDSEFRSQALYQWLRERSCSAMLGVRGDTWVADTADGSTAPLAERVPRDAIVYLNGVYLTSDHCGPVNVIAWWAKDADGKWMLRAVMTDLPATWQTYRFGRRRMWIETIFRDWQSQGFDLDACGIIDPDRFSRLLLVIIVAYLWLVAVGRYVVKKGWRAKVDDGPSRTWKYSLFQIARGWFERCISLERPFPVVFFLYM